jgi:hypothetical protein
MGVHVEMRNADVREGIAPRTTAGGERTEWSRRAAISADTLAHRAGDAGLGVTV